MACGEGQGRGQGRGQGWGRWSRDPWGLELGAVAGVGAGRLGRTLNKSIGNLGNESAGGPDPVAIWEMSRRMALTSGTSAQRTDAMGPPEPPVSMS